MLCAALSMCRIMRRYAARQCCEGEGFRELVRYFEYKFLLWVAGTECIKKHWREEGRATSLTSQDGHASTDHLLLGGSLKRKLMLHHNFLSLYQCQLEDVVQFAPLRAFPSGTQRTTLLRNWVVQCWHGASIGLCWFASTITPKPMCPCD